MTHDGAARMAYQCAKAIQGALPVGSGVIVLMTVPDADGSRAMNSGAAGVTPEDAHDLLWIAASQNPEIIVV